MRNLINNIKEVKNISEGIVNIPFNYIVFLCTLFLVWQPDYIEMIDASSWVPKNIKNIILDLVNSLYSNIGIVFCSLIAILVVLMLLTSKSNVFNKILPKDLNYNDDSTVSWNQYSAIRRVISIIISLATKYWIYYFLINVLFNENNYVKNFLVHNSIQSEHEIIISRYIIFSNQEVIIFLFYLNIVISMYLVIRSLFEIRIPLNKHSIKADEINSYIQLNSFQKENSIGEKNETIILKTKYREKPEFLLVNVQLTKYGEKSTINQINWGNIEILAHRKIYDIIDSSDNLGEIIYHFEFLKDK